MQLKTDKFRLQSSPSLKNKKNQSNLLLFQNFILRESRQLFIKKIGLREDPIIKHIIQLAKCMNKNLNKFGLMIKIRNLQTKGEMRKLEKP